MTERHIFKCPPRSEEDPHMETCELCGHNLRDGIHLRTNETDIEPAEIHIHMPDGEKVLTMKRRTTP